MHIPFSQQRDYQGVIIAKAGGIRVWKNIIYDVRYQMSGIRAVVNEPYRHTLAYTSKQAGSVKSSFRRDSDLQLAMGHRSVVVLGSFCETPSPCFYP